MYHMECIWNLIHISSVIAARWAPGCPRHAAAAGRPSPRSPCALGPLAPGRFIYLSLTDMCIYIYIMYIYIFT